MGLENPIREFFPAIFEVAYSILDGRYSGLLDYLFPDTPHIPTLCFKAFGRNLVDVKWPGVALAASLGCIPSFIIGRRIFRQTKLGFRGSYTWGLALLWYSLMCLGGLCYHSFAKLDFFYRVDVLGTACSSASIAAGCFDLDDRNPMNRTLLFGFYVLAAALTTFGSQIWSEALYLIPTAIAFVGGLWLVILKGYFEVERKKEKRRKLAEWRRIAGLGAGLGLIGMVANPSVFGLDLGDIFWFFLGCNIAILALVRVALISNGVKL